MLSWQELRDVSFAGIEVGAHTVSHPQLDILATAEADTEIRDSKNKLEDELGQSVQSFAYPHGYASRTTRRLVRESGFTSACRVGHALASTGEDLYALSRIIMTSSIGVDDLHKLLSGSVLPVAPPADRLVSTGWRMARRVYRLSQALG